MGSQVAVAEVAVVPTFKGFRRLVTQETDGSAKAGAQGFAKAFAKTGTDSGKQVGVGFKKAFGEASNGTSDRLVKQLEAGVAKASRALSDARLKEQDAAGKTRIAEKQLAEAREKYSRDSSQVIRAEERLETASRNLARAHERTEEATDDLKRSQGELARAADHAGDELSEAGRMGITGFRDNVTGGVKSFAGPLIAAFAALGIGNIVANAFTDAFDFVKQSIGLASDLEQSVGGVDAVFGEQADAIKQWSKDAAGALGLSQTKYNEFATVIGSQFKNMGVPMDEVAGKTNDLITLAGDLSATYGGTTSDAVSALSSLLRGERDPIEKYGVSISDATVEAGLLAKGLDGLEGPAREEAKRQETLAQLYTQTKDAQGGAIREQDSYASKMQQNAAKWENLSARIGEAFLPVASSIGDVLSDEVFPVIEDLVEKYGPELADAFTDVLPDLTELAKELLPQLPGLLQQTADVLPTVVDLVGVLAPLFADGARDVATATKAIDGFFQLLSGDSSILDTIGDLRGFEGPLADIGNWAGDAGAHLGTAFYNARHWVEARINEIVGFVQGLPARTLEALGNLENLLVQSGKDLMGGFLKGIEAMTKPIGDAVSGVLDWVGGFFPHSPADRGPFSGSGWTQLAKSGEATWDQYVSGMGKTGPQFPTFSGGGAVSMFEGVVPSVLRSTAPATVNQYNTFQNTDTRIAIRQLGREAGRAFAAS